MNKCNWHLCNNLSDSKFCCLPCKNKFYVDRRRKDIKTKAVAYLSGKCFCGYDRCERALEFHHLDPLKKDFNIARSGYTRSWNSVKKEIEKCILVCSNCHREIHDGMHDQLKLIELQEQQLLNGIDLEIEKIKVTKVKNVNIKISKMPNKETLEELIWKLPCVKIGEMFGVSDNAVNKWCKIYGLSKPGRGYWAKINANIV